MFLNLRSLTISSLAPNFLIIGSMKSGTTSLHQYLSCHKDIYMTIKKEPKFFLYDNEHQKINGFTKSEMRKISMRGYNGESLIGESTTDYTATPLKGLNTPKNIFLANPGMKFIYIIRNPLERIISHYKGGIRQRWISKENQDINIFIPKWEHGLQVSLYYNQLNNYLNIFNRNQFKVILFDDLITDTTQTINSILEFLGLDISRYYLASFKVYNKAPKEQNVDFVDIKFTLDNYNMLMEDINPDIKKMELFLDRDLSLWDLSENTWVKK